MNIVQRKNLDKYCSFMPIPIYFEAIKTAEEQARIDEAEKKAKEEEEKRKAEEAAKKAADGEAVEAETEAEPTEKAPEAPKPINETTPLWAKHPNECTDEEYKEFYHRVFPCDYKEPLFWIHLNMDYPFNLKGIFTSRRSTLSMIPSRVQLSCTTIRYLLPIILRK